MATHYCFICDDAVDGAVCPTCGRTAWEMEEPSTAEEPPAPDKEESGAVPESVSRAREPLGVPLADFEQQPRRELPAPPPIFLDEQDRGPTIGDTLSRWIPERRWGAMAAVAAFALVIFAVVQVPSGLDEGQPPPVTEPPTDVTRATLPDFVPDPREARPAQVPGGTWIGLVDPESGNTLGLLGREQADSGPLSGLGDVRPDGTSVVVSPIGQISLFSGTTAAELPLPLVLPQAAYAGKLALSPDGRRIAALGADETLAVWDQDAGTTSIPLPASAQTLHWSPDSGLIAATSIGRGYTVWDAASGGLISAAGDGSLLAISARAAAVWTGEQLVITDLQRNLLRTWPDFTINQEQGLPPAEFDPNTRFLAVRVATPGADQPLEGLWVLSVLGSRQDQLVPGQQSSKSFAWSGSGELLYYLEGGNLVAWPADPTFDVTTIAEEIAPVLAPPISHLRLYDHALVPAGALIKGAIETSPISEDLIVGWPPAPHADPTWEAQRLHATATLSDLCEVTERSADDGPGPGAGGIPIALIEAAEATVIETDQGLICVERPGSIEPSLFEGSALSMLGEDVLFTDGAAVHAVSGFTSLNVLAVEDLGAERILAIAAARDSLFVLAVDGERSIVHQIPMWSNTLGLPFRTGESLDAPPLVVLVGQASTRGRILAAPDGQTLAVELIDQGVVQLLSYPESNSTSPCEPGQLGACAVMSIAGRAIDFSPSGDWLMVETPQGQAVAVSTRLRGSVPLRLDTPLAGVWIGSGSLG